jgi:hypothetical protein
MKKIALLALFMVSSTVIAQKIDVKNGDFGFLKGQSELNVEFKYDNLKLMKDNISHEEYVSKRVAELNDKNKGTGDAWAKRWASAPEQIWNPKFLELVNKYYGTPKNLNMQEGLKNAKYTLIVDVVWIFPGWDVAMMKQAAKVSTVLRFVETANRSNVLLEIHTKDAPGDQWGSNFSNESRIGEGFAKTGKSLGKLMEKKVK